MYAPAKPTKLVVLSNRLPFTIESRPDGPRIARAPGGLVTALEPVMAERGGVWIGWDGLSREDAPNLAVPVPDAPEGVRYRTVPLSGRDIARYYEGFSNRTLWPLFHYFVDRMHVDVRNWRAYESVNERFAQAAAAESTPHSLIWVHDYQLLRVPHYLRRTNPGQRIAFFLHIPFPAYDVFRVLPQSRQILRGMLAADLVGFHVPSYAEHFLTCAERLLGCEVDRKSGTVNFEGRAVAVQSHPLGVDAAHLEELAAASGRRPDRRAQPRERVASILGVDRLDYSKGVHERLLAIERLFETHLSHRRKVQFTQVLVPSRERVEEYGLLKREIDETIGRINGRFSERGWTPIGYMVRSFPPEDLVALYCQSEIVLVTPLRDGMNLVAKEYAATRLNNDGVLVLSEFAGAAEELQEAMLVNPFDVDAVAESLHQALVMSAEEKRARMSALRDRIRSNDVHAWVRKFLAAAESAWEEARATVVSPAESVRHALEAWLGTRTTVALFLDYDGTLTPLVDHPEDADLGDAAKEILEQAARTPNIDLAVVSGRSLDDLRKRVGVSGITLVGNHGYEIEGPGISYRHPGVDFHLASVERAAEKLAEIDIPGTHVEHKGPTIAFHLRRVEPSRKGEATRRGLAVFRQEGLRVLVGNEVVEGRPPLEWHKGQAVLHVLKERHGSAWPSRVRAVYIGDDATDEDAFRSLRGIGRSVQVGSPSGGRGVTADFLLPDPGAVLQLLRWLASGGFVTVA